MTICGVVILQALSTSNLGRVAPIRMAGNAVGGVIGNLIVMLIHSALGMARGAGPIGWVGGVASGTIAVGVAMIQGERVIEGGVVPVGRV